MKKKVAIFKLGDAVFYPAAGVGRIEAVEDIFIGGQFDSCYVIRIRDSGMVVKVPLQSIHKTGIRPLVNCKKLKDLYKVLSSKPARRVTGGNWTERCKELERKINKGSCLELGEVVRDLLRWKNQSGLSFEEAMLLETARAHLANEVAIVQGIAPEAAANKILNQVGVVAA